MATKHEYSSGEKKMIVNCYEYFKTLKALKLFKGTRTRQQVADCLGCAPSTLTSVVDGKKRNPDTNVERVLNEPDFRYMKGEKRHMYADSETNIAFVVKWIKNFT
ncbi:hypothetical protein PHMEG_00039016 [Phytophthora megakarya]|uniref:Uncharacterized protein n=1 Tax=Phytophthora megakarya TaxID=4795 RepID=A0A225UG99_9STRA|nr:hypothetical protein PHMEG_00039016 [Phytophthora megakarya]